MTEIDNTVAIPGGVARGLPPFLKVKSAKLLVSVTTALFVVPTMKK